MYGPPSLGPGGEDRQLAEVDVASRPPPGRGRCAPSSAWRRRRAPAWAASAPCPAGRRAAATSPARQMARACSSRSRDAERPGHPPPRGVGVDEQRKARPLHPLEQQRRAAGAHRPLGDRADLQHRIDLAARCAELAALLEEADEARPRSSQCAGTALASAAPSAGAAAAVAMAPDIRSSCRRTGVRQRDQRRRGSARRAGRPSAATASSASAAAFCARPLDAARGADLGQDLGDDGGGRPRFRPGARARAAPSAGSASQASSTGRVSFPSCRSWPTDLPAVASSIALSSTSSAIWKRAPERPAVPLERLGAGRRRPSRRRARTRR